MQPRHTKFLFSLLLLLLLIGCAQLPAIKDGDTTNPIKEQAIALETAGDYAAAARLFEELANQTLPPGDQALLLRAAENYLHADEPEQATALLERINTATIPSLDFQKRLLVAELALSRNRPDEAMSLLTDGIPTETPIDLQQRYHSVKAESFRLAGNLLESARELGELDLLITDMDKRLQNQLLIIQTLSALTDTALDLLQPNPPGIQGGWMSLARIIKGHTGDTQQIQKQIELWREKFPSHPAIPGLLEGYFEKLGSQYQRPNHIAIMLPKSGPYANAARALRDGFMAAYYQQPTESRPRLVFYDDSDSADTWPLYRQAVESGADMVIGPLTKEGVSQLARAGELEIPVLALNQVPPETTPPVTLFQFGLSPEDEARQVAERAWLDGHTRAIAFTPKGDWGDRVLNAFRNRWERLGGTLSEQQRYDARDNDFSAAIQSLLNLDESQSRRSRLQQILRQNLEFEPRRREDADFIFLAANPLKARQIRPQFQFHHAADMPIYATSSIYSGSPSPDADQDLDGIKFPDIPWLLMNEGDSPLSLENLAQTLPGSQGALRRLYAMGIDSFRLLPHLGRLQSSSRETIDGKTGNLYLDSIRQVHRQLVWAEMVKGKPRAIGYAPRMATLADEMEELATTKGPIIIEETAPEAEQKPAESESDKTQIKAAE
ncbi:MAG: ABC transporter substrate-binding protein [Sedimenticola thiotaurini]|uniref:ABC transporter substrate-binding protein n=1 Tax=Sedimenticola thiotaurini TaxID=1543721 RepID=A0A558D0J8_9GAMM|nr:MAG: ABC transporter substrate-binding protein [Sedimenticola thiotaurini]